MKMGCVFLAAGLSKRFGRNKLLEAFEGKPLVEWAFDALPAPLFSDIVVVTAYDEVEALAHARGFRTIRNEHPEAGIGGTIKLGIALMGSMDACMVCVCDQPYMNRNTLQRMAEVYSGGILAVSSGRQRGNPVIFPHSLYTELLAIEDDGSGRSVIERHPDMLTLFPAADKKELEDVDYLHDIGRHGEKKNLFLTGEKNVGKSVLLRRALEESGLRYSGFCTLPYEIEGHEAGYYIHALSGQIELEQNDKPISVRAGEGRRIPIAKVFDRFGSLYLKTAGKDATEVILMDELGVIEEGAHIFQSAVEECLNGEIPVIGVIKAGAGGWLNRIRARDDTEIFLLDEKNKTAVWETVIKFLKNAKKEKPNEKAD